MNKQETIAHFTQATKECLAKAAVLYPEIADALTQTEIKFNIRSGGLGEARFSRITRETLIRYNLAAALLNPAKFADTVPHEVAHIVCFLRGTDRGHGRAWRETCRVLGGDSKRLCAGRHFAELPRITRGTRYYRWEGPDGGRWISKRDHGRLTECSYWRTVRRLDTCIAEQVMTKDEMQAAVEADRTANSAALAATEAALANAREVLAILKKASRPWAKPRDSHHLI